MKRIKINNKWIGDGYPCYTVAEIGTGFKNFDEAKNLIDSAIEIKIDAIKFQTFEAETITTKKNYVNLKETGKISQYDLFKELEVSKELQMKIVNYANEKGITIFSAPSHMKDLETMKSMNLPAYKIGSDLACHIPLLKEVAKLEKPIILSTGMCNLDEVKESVRAILSTGNDQVILMHCVSNYPSLIEEINLNAIITMKNEFDFPIGYSDHSIGILPTLTAATLGANIIEKHFHHEKNAASPDDIHSLVKEEFQELIKQIRMIELAKGSGLKEPTKSELDNIQSSRVSIIASSNIQKGTLISENLIDIKRPGTGIPPKFFSEIMGKRTLRDIEKDEPITMKDIE